MKVKIKRWNAVATWRWDIPEDDVCGICQVHFDGTCPTCKFPGDDCGLCKWRAASRFGSGGPVVLTEPAQCLASVATISTWYGACRPFDARDLGSPPRPT